MATFGVRGAQQQGRCRKRSAPRSTVACGSHHLGSGTMGYCNQADQQMALWLQQVNVCDCSRAIWGPCRPQREHRGLGYRMSPVPGSAPTTVTQSPSSGPSATGRRGRNTGHSCSSAGARLCPRSAGLQGSNGPCAEPCRTQCRTPPRISNSRPTPDRLSSCGERNGFPTILLAF